MIVVSVSGGKDSIAQILKLVEHYGANHLVAHYQVIPEQWNETLSYVQDVLDHVGVRLIAQQVLYKARPGTERGVQRLEIRDIHTPGDIVHPGTSSVIAGVTDLAKRRRWPPSPSVRFCTSYFKRDLLNAWIVQNRDWLGDTVIVALGERAAESSKRAQKDELWPRLRRKSWMAWNWLPIHQASRREVFRKLHDWGIKPHPAYRYQGMSESDMYDRNEEGGPRCGCRFCIYASTADVCHQAEMIANRELLHRLVQLEQETGRTWWRRRAAADILRQATNNPCETKDK